jgi:subfamily B ATP-binding cassette protein MsbA
VNLQRLNPVSRLDPRISRELAAQKRSISIGLVCVVFAALLDFLLLNCLNTSVSAIQNAAPQFSAERAKLEQKRSDLEGKADQVSSELRLDRGTTEKLFDDKASELLNNSKTASSSEFEFEVSTLANAIHQPAEKVRRILAKVKNKPKGDLDAVNTLGIYCLAVVAIFACKYWFTRGQTYYLTAAASRLSSDLRERMYAKLLRLPVSYFSNKRIGAIQSILTNDVNVYQNAVSAIRESIQGPISIAVSFGFVVWKVPQLGGVVVLFIPAMVYVINRNGRRIKVSQARVQEDLSELSASTVESLQGMRVVKAFAGESSSQARYSGLVERSYESQLAAGRRLAALRPLVELMGATALAIVLYICGWLSYEDKLALGGVAALLLALDRINQGLRNLSSVTATYNQVQAASDRIYGELLEVPDQRQEEGAKELPNVRGQIEFEDVTFRYPDGTEALRNVSFRLEPGTSLALVGPSGAGKSTIADLILRFYDPSEGRITLDGVDLRELDLHWLRNQIGVVPQNTFLFAGSIADNIRMGKPDASAAEIRQAACAANADEFIDKMDQGYESEVGEGGNRVSGGQRQRIAIARALVRKPTLLLLDEATSALDATSERAVTEALDEIMKQRTSLFIAHRLTTAARADRILVLARGKVVEDGSHSELMAANGQYAALFRIFSGGLLEENLG